MGDSGHTGSTFISDVSLRVSPGVSLGVCQRSMRVNVSANFVAEGKASNEYPQLKQNFKQCKAALSEEAGSLLTSSPSCNAHSLSK